jgi:phage gp36-like protein
MSTVVPLWSGPSPWYPPWWFRTWKQRPVPLEGEPGGAEGATHPTERIHPSVAEAGEGEAGAVPTIAHIGQPRYADPEDLARVGLTHRALLGTAENVQETALQFASRLADSYLGVRFRVPLFRWGDDLRLNVAQIAAWRIMAARGYDPSTPNDQQVLRVSYEDAIAWLQQIRARQAVLAPPAGVVSGGPPWGWGGGWGQRWPPERWQDAGPRCVVF